MKKTLSGSIYRLHCVILYSRKYQLRTHATPENKWHFEIKMRTGNFFFSILKLCNDLFHDWKKNECKIKFKNKKCIKFSQITITDLRKCSHQPREWKILFGLWKLRNNCWQWKVVGYCYNWIFWDFKNFKRIERFEDNIDKLCILNV